MKRMTHVLCILVCLLLCGRPDANGQSFSNVGRAGSNFLKIPVDASGAALGNALVAHASGVDGISWNPGALGFTEGTELMFTTVDWIIDSRVSFLAVAQRVGPGTVGASLTALTMDQMEITTEEQPDGTGSYFRAGSYCASLSYGMRVIDRFSFGLSVKYLYDYIWETHGSTFAFDLGSVYLTNFHNLRIGMRIANFGGNITFSGSPVDHKAASIPHDTVAVVNDPRLERVAKDYTLPQVFNVGIAIDPLVSENHRLTFLAGVNDPVDNNAQIVTGVEYAYQDFLFLRAGYKEGYDEQKLSFGVGLRADLFDTFARLDYAWVDLGRLGGSNSITLRAIF